mmetsp:Transcript_4665/g.17278  ORF Transcript_4665/g.17278 Transcript_4665/m.17278 type:complete len:225 (-) Transcript_4665:1052-1726(-)
MGIHPHRIPIVYRSRCCLPMKSRVHRRLAFPNAHGFCASNSSPEPSTLPVGGGRRSSPGTSKVIIAGNNPVFIRVSIIGPLSNDVATDSFPLVSNTRSTPFRSTPFTTPERNISFVSSGRSSSASIKSRSNTRSIIRFSINTFNTSALSTTKTLPTPLSTSLTASAPPSASMRFGNPCARSAATTPASSNASPVPPILPSSASDALPDCSRSKPTSAAASGARD